MPNHDEPSANGNGRKVVPRSSRTTDDEDPMRALGIKVQKAIDFAVTDGGGTIQISIDDPDHGTVFLKVQSWGRR